MKSITRMIAIAVVVMFVQVGGAFAISVNEDGVTYDQINSEQLDEMWQQIDFLFHMQTPEMVQKCLRQIGRTLGKCHFEGPTVSMRAQELKKVLEEAMFTALHGTDAKVIIAEIGTEVSETYLKLYNAFHNPPASEMSFGL